MSFFNCGSSLMRKTELWFLQTHLTIGELRFVFERWVEFYRKNFSATKIIESVVRSRTRQIDLCTKFENMKSTDSFDTGTLLSVFEVALLTKKRYSQGFPLALHFWGNPHILKNPLIAIVGSRHPTYYGREQAHVFAKSFAKAGCTVVSGGAIGIDTIANSCAWEEKGGSVVVLGSGLNHPYPSSNISLFQKMRSSTNGLVVSEFSPQEAPTKWSFPRRNHTIAALADYVLVIEAAESSGSIITAMSALDLGIDVGAIPNRLGAPLSSGTNKLIQEGAFCVQQPQDVLERVFRTFQQRQLELYVEKNAFY